MSTKKFTYTEEVTGEIVQIPANLLHHHHDNPRKDLGDLTELTESIRAKGILQNLTVVPFWFPQTGVGCDDPAQQAEMGYLVVIGNRRMEAGKAAGLETFPCIIAKMTPAEQVQTMLLENMQRSDLTAYEQAQGFQMMLDFGDTVETIAEKTGFSQPTIRRRLKMAELDADTLKAEREKEKAQTEKAERERALHEAEQRAVELRTKFVQGLSESKIRDNLPAIVAFLMWLAFYNEYDSGYSRLFGKTYDEEDGYKDEDEARIAAVTDAIVSPYRALMALVCGTVSEDFFDDCSDWRHAFRKNEELEQAYKLLRALGYEMSDEEAELMDGSSDLYTKEGEQ